MKVAVSRGMLPVMQGRHLRGAGEASPQPKEKEKRKKRKKQEKQEKREKKREKRKKGTMNNVKLLHTQCCFFQCFNSPVALKILKKFAPQEKVEMTPLQLCHLTHPI